MCGIIGLCARTAIDDARFRQARDRMTARGPDASGFEAFDLPRGGACLFGQRRLSIQDLSAAGAQPMTSGCGRYVIVYNGEVYNVPTLRERLEAKGHAFRSTSDTEVILEGFVAWGPAVVEKLNGIFAFAIWDKRENQLFAARDRIGIKPFYFSQEGGVFCFASDARALRDLGVGTEIDRMSLALYLCLGYVPAPRSIWSGIDKLDAGCTLTWSPGEHAKVQHYWAAPDDIDSDETPRNLAQLIDEVVEEQLLSDVPVGLFLSGGLDSSMVASSIAEIGASGSNVKALTVGFPEYAEGDEAPVAERTAKLLGLDCEVLHLSQDAQSYFDAAVDALDEPLAFSAIVTQTAISQLAAQAGLKVVLSGDGGDEIFGGYRWYDTSLQEIVHAAKNAARPQNLKERVLPDYRLRAQNRARTAEYMAKDPLFAHAQSVFAGLRPDQVAALMPEFSEADITETLAAALKRHDAPAMPEKRRRQRIDLYTFCQDVVLTKVDRAGMAFSVEARPPLLDHRIIEWGLSRPIAPQHDAAPKNALRQIIEQRGLGFLLTEPKRGFSLKGNDRPSRRAVQDLISTQTGALGLEQDWAKHVPREGGNYTQKLATMHWLARWHKAMDAPT